VPDVLIVDDDAAVARTHQKLLERAGFAVTTADNGLAALGELQQHVFQVILLDVRMPFLEGTGFYQELAKTYPDLTNRVVFVTGFAEDPNVRTFLRDVGRPVLIKPVEFDDLVTAVKRVVEGPASGRRAGTAARVLVVDDDAPLRATVRRALVAAGYEVTEAGGGEAALQALGAHPPVDLLITDMYMPGMDGVELTIRARREGRPLKVIAMSGGGYMKREDVLDVARKIGAARTLEKPFTPDELLAAVEVVLKS